MSNSSQSVSKLIKELQKQDSDTEHEYEVSVPEKAIAKLIEIGTPAVEYLLPLLNHPNKYSCAYAVEILEAIGDKRAMEPLVKLLVDEDFDDLEEYFGHSRRLFMSEMLESALEKMGPSVMDLVLSLLDKYPDHYYLPVVVGKIGAKFHDERAFQHIMKRIQQTGDLELGDYVELLGDYGDKRAVPCLIQLLGKDVPGEDTVLHALSEICDIESYRRILMESAKETVGIVRRKVSSAVEGLVDAYSYPDKYEGEASQKWELYTRERRIRETVEDLARNAARLGRLERVISKKEQETIVSVADKIRKETDELPRNFGVDPTIASTIGSRYYPHCKHKEEKKYRGLDRVKDQIIAATVEWLRSKGFKTLVKNQVTIWGWKEEGEAKIKGAYVGVAYGVRVQDWGEGWKDDEVKPFLDELLAVVDKAARKK